MKTWKVAIVSGAAIIIVAISSYAVVEVVRTVAIFS